MKKSSLLRGGPCCKQHL